MMEFYSQFYCCWVVVSRELIWMHEYVESTVYITWQILCFSFSSNPVLETRWFVGSPWPVTRIPLERFKIPSKIRVEDFLNARGLFSELTWICTDIAMQRQNPAGSVTGKRTEKASQGNFFFLENRQRIRYHCFKYLMNIGGKHEPGSWQDSQVKYLLALIWSKPLALLQKGFCHWLFWDQAVMWEFSWLNWLSLLDIHVFALNANLFLTRFHWSFVLW